MKTHHSAPPFHLTGKIAAALHPTPTQWLALGVAGYFLYRQFKPKGKRDKGRLRHPGAKINVGKLLEKSLKKSKGPILLGRVHHANLWDRLLRKDRFKLGPKHRERHMQVMGPTRSGKSQLLLALAAQDMARGMPVFYMEAKGDTNDFKQFLALAERCGRLDDVRYFNPADQRSMTFNPILPVTGQDTTSLANELSRMIGREPGKSGNGEYYEGIDYARIQTMSEVFISTGRAFTLKDAFHYFEFERCRERAFSYCKNPSLIAKAKAQFGPGKTDTSGLTSKLGPWISGFLGDLLNSESPQIRLEDLFENNRLTYMAIPVGHLQVMANALGRMVISGLMGVAFRRQSIPKKPGPASVILDEFPEFATPVFANFITTVGSAKFWTVFSHQNLGQLRRVVGMDPDDFFSTLYSNTPGCKVFFHIPHPGDAELIARAIGTCAQIKITEMVEDGMFGESSTGRKSLREVEEFIAHPNLLRSLPPGTAVAWAHGKKAAVISTVAARELKGLRTGQKLPDVRPKPAQGLNLEAALDGKSWKADRDFSGLPAGPVGTK